MKLSIITVNLNNVTGLRKTIESVINQTHTNYEYIIIDGGSTDGSIEVIMEYADRIKYWISEPDKGIYSAMNKGILQAKGEYLQFLNSGDWLVDEEVLSSVFGAVNKFDIIYGHARLISSNMESRIHVLPEDSEVSMMFFISGTITHQSAFIHRSLFTNSLYDENYRICSDWKFFIQKIIFQNCTLKFVNRVIVNYDINGFSSNPEFFKLHRKEKDKILSELLPKRIAADYQKFGPIMTSPIVKYLPLLSKTTRFQKLVTGIVCLLINIYMCFKSKKERTELERN